MADNTNKTDTGNIPPMDDTITRKTLKLTPLGKEEGGDNVKPIVDPLTMRNTETGPLGAMDDTRTRKTVKLKATNAGTVSLEGTPKVDLKPVVDPLTIRNTETGPLGAMVDTRTRKTVKLKPLKTAGDGNVAPGEPEVIPAKTPAAEAPQAPEPAAAGGTPEAPTMLQDTNTRKTLKLKAVTPGESKPQEGGMLTDTSTRRTLKLKAVTPGESKPQEGGMLTDTNTRKTLKLKAVTPGEAKPGLSSESSTGHSLQDTNTRKTLKLKAIKPEGENAAAGSEPQTQEQAPFTLTPKTLTPKTPAPAGEAPAPKKEEPLDDTRTQNVSAPSTDTSGISKDLDHTADDTIKIERPKPKPDAMPLPSLGAPAAAKTVNNKETVKLRPSTSMPQGAAGDEIAAKASKATIKLSPPSALKTPEKPEAPVVPPPKPPEAAPAEAAEAPKPKLTIGKAPPPKTPPKEEEGEGEAAPAGPGGLKLKSMAPKAEAPRAAADQEKIKEKKKGGPKAKSQASPVYTAVAVIALVLVTFGALATTAQFFDLWEPESSVGKQIVPHVKGIMDNLMKSLTK